MTATLQEAIAAVRQGETERAQLLAAEVIKDNPDDANAWYLLSQLVDSDARRAAYLNKTLALDPAYERARAELGALPVATAAAPVAAVVEVVADSPGAAEEGVPEWLRPLSPEPVPEVVAAAPSPAEEVAPAVAAPPPAPARPRPAPPPPPPPRRQGNGALTALLVLLALLTVAVLAILAYLLLY